MPQLSRGQGPVDVHAHLLPRSCYEVPRAGGALHVRVRAGELWVGELPTFIDPQRLSDPEETLSDMKRAGLAVRAVSAPPFAFVVDNVRDGPEYCRTFNRDVEQICEQSAGTLVGLGIVPLGSRRELEAELREIAERGRLAGVAIPPLVGEGTLDDGPLRLVLELATELDLAVLVHPRQLPQPGMDPYYLRNLLGNPVESAMAVGALLLGGVLEELPSLRICFVHGCGCTAAVLGRWDHGWRVRPEPSARSSRPPSEGFKQIYCDTLTHGEEQLRLLMTCADPTRLVLGSDYPFDMGDADPCETARAVGLKLAQLTDNAHRFLCGRDDAVPVSRQEQETAA